MTSDFQHIEKPFKTFHFCNSRSCSRFLSQVVEYSARVGRTGLAVRYEKNRTAASRGRYCTDTVIRPLNQMHGADSASVRATGY
jgi:hypothetical protein